VPDIGEMPRFRASCSLNAWVPQPITSSVIAIHVLISGAEALQKRLIGMLLQESRRPGCPPDQLGLCTCPHL